MSKQGGNTNVRTKTKVMLLLVALCLLASAVAYAQSCFKCSYQTGPQRYGTREECMWGNSCHWAECGGPGGDGSQPFDCLMYGYWVICGQGGPSPYVDKCQSNYTCNCS